MELSSSPIPLFYNQGLWCLSWFQLVTVLVRVSVTIIKHHEQKQLGVKWFISAYIQVLREGKSGWALEVERRQRSWRDCLLARSLCFAQPAFSITQGLLLRSGLSYLG